MSAAFHPFAIVSSSFASIGHSINNDAHIAHLSIFNINQINLGDSEPFREHLIHVKTNRLDIITVYFTQTVPKKRNQFKKEPNLGNQLVEVINIEKKIYPFVINVQKILQWIDQRGRFPMLQGISQLFGHKILNKERHEE